MATVELFSGAASPTAFQQAKDTVRFAWKWTVTLIREAGDKIGFVFFSIVECVCPFLGPKIHNAFLYVRLSFQAFWNARTIEDLNQEINGLQEQVFDIEDLRSQNQHLTLLVQQAAADKLRMEENLRRLGEANEAASRQLQAFMQQQPDILAREQAVVKERDLMVQKSQEIQKQNEELIFQRNGVAQGMLVAIHEHSKISQQLQQVRREVLDLRDQLRQHDELAEILERIGKASEGIPHLGQKSQIDTDLEELLPLLLRQIETAQAALREAKGELPPLSSAEVVLSSFERIMDQIVKDLERIPKVLKLHANWQDPINQLIYSQQVEV